ncbi:hypothetical protein [Krasilnikovia sp. MM14-A1259]|uniref:hypothetical protein n=1 Tax=Krasilnikovia sp. MM14-A1259 TaxID=3373539 RepID=UPI00380BDC87
MTDNEYETAAELQAHADAARAAEGFLAGDVQIDYDGTAELPPVPEGEPMVMRGVRIPAEMDRRIKAAADRAGIPFSALIRQWIELGLTESEDDQSVSLAHLRRAIAHVVQHPPAA